MAGGVGRTGRGSPGDAFWKRSPVGYVPEVEGVLGAWPWGGSTQGPSDGISPQLQSSSALLPRGAPSDIPTHPHTTNIPPRKLSS